MVQGFFVYLSPCKTDCFWYLNDWFHVPITDDDVETTFDVVSFIYMSHTYIPDNKPFPEKRSVWYWLTQMKESAIPIETSFQA